MSSAIFPSNNSWVTPRAIEGQITTENARIMLPQKIEKLNRVYVYLPNFKIQFSQNFRNAAPTLHEIYIDANHTQSLAALDITNYIVEKAKYETLTTYKAASMPGAFGPRYTNNTWYYEHNGTDIVLVGEYIRGNISRPGDKPITAYVITSAVYNYIYNNGKKNGILYVHFDNEALPDSSWSYTDDLTISYGHAAYGEDIRRFPFRVYYTPLGESVKLQVPKTNPQPNQFCIPYSQQQPIVDNTTLGREMQSVANRAGCEKKEVVRTLHKLSDIRNPHGHYYWRERDAQGNFNGNVWKLTSANLQIYSESLMRVTI